MKIESLAKVNAAHLPWVAAKVSEALQPHPDQDLGDPEDPEDPEDLEDLEDPEDLSMWTYETSYSSERIHRRASLLH